MMTTRSFFCCETALPMEQYLAARPQGVSSRIKYSWINAIEPLPIERLGTVLQPRMLQHPFLWYLFGTGLDLGDWKSARHQMTPIVCIMYPRVVLEPIVGFIERRYLLASIFASQAHFMLTNNALISKNGTA